MAKQLNCVIAVILITLIAAPVYGSSWFQHIRQGNKDFTKIHFYLHDQSPAYIIAQSSITATSPTSFGTTYALDDSITTKPDVDSKEVGRVQGMVASTDLKNSALTMNLVFYFTTGKFNGSTIAALGRNPILKEIRELAVVGGTGDFRMARGYIITKTHSFDTKAQTGVFEYTLYVTCD